MTFDLAAEESLLRGRREAYVRATVVWARRPVSAQPGDKAVVTADGHLRGWVGGSCAEPVVVREAVAALAAGEPRLLRLGPVADLPHEEEGVVLATVSCASEGSVQVFLEPVDPAPHLVVVGRSPMVQALVAMAGLLGFETVVVESEDAAPDLAAGGASVVTDLDLAKADVGPASFVVVATMGRYDEAALQAALDSPARYVALVASSRRAATVLESLRAAGVAHDQLARVKSPAGLPLGDVPHAEMAVSILAEIVREKAAHRVAPATEVRPAPTTAVDPVCGMTVDVNERTPSAERDGKTYWFCCPGCRWRFLNPA
ncbi:MAG TPA: XdhC family protein [Acidimicrobiales bacterium]